jgi:Holliday junction resolvase-like predicted endonuclease
VIKEEMNMDGLSEKAVNWLKEHGFYRTAQNVEEAWGRLTFMVCTERREVVVNEVQLSNGSWSFHTIKRGKK